jgi:hypothetical protein
MATTALTRTSGTAAAGEFVGRDLKFVNLNYSGIAATQGTVDGNLEKAARVLSKFSTITAVGTAATDDVIFMVEGLPSGSVNDVTGTSRAIAAALKADLEASIGSGTATFTIYSGLGSTGFVA